MTTNASLAARLAPLLERVTALSLTLAWTGVGLIVISIGTCTAYDTSGPLPPPGPPPRLAETATVMSYRYKEGFYRAQLDEDCQKVGLEKIEPTTLLRANSYGVEFSGSQRLRIGRKLNTSSLRLRLVRRRLWIGEPGEGLRAWHVVLQITNKTNKHLAYRVKTRVKGECDPKGVIDHNAVALKPKQRQSRTECVLRRSSRSLVVTRVEVFELRPLGYHYVTRLDPAELKFDERAASGHDFGELGPCKLVPWRAIGDGMAQDKVHWRDVVDFYSRHNCDEYTFHVGYKWSPNDLSSPLPVKPPRVGG